MKKIFISSVFMMILLNLSVVRAQTYTQDYSSMPDTLLHVGAYVSEYATGIPVMTTNNGNLEITSDEDYQRPFTWWIVKFDEPLDLSGSDNPGALLPILSVKLKSTETCYAQFTLVSEHPDPIYGRYGANTDLLVAEATPEDMKFKFEVPGDGEYHDFSYDFSGQFYDLFGSIAGSSLGVVDSTKIIGYRVSINFGFGEAWQQEGSLLTGDDYFYNTPFGANFDGSGTGATLSIKDLTLGEDDDSTVAILDKAVIYPNPVFNKLKVFYKLNATANVNVQVRDLMGNLVDTQGGYYHRGYHKEIFESADLNRGFYNVSILVNGEPVKQLKFFKL